MYSKIIIRITILLLFVSGNLVSGQKINNQIDTSDYSKLPFRDSTIDASSGQGYIDTFSVFDSHFRLVHHDTLYDGIVEKNINGAWVRCFEVDNMGNYNDYSLKDVDGDGYKDFVKDNKWDSEVYFFDPVIDNFINLSTAHISQDWVILDSTEMVFCDFQEGKEMKGQIYSTLYEFRGFYRKELYQVELDNNKNEDVIGGLILKKCNRIMDYCAGMDCYVKSLTVVKKIKLDKPIDLTKDYRDSGYFDYKSFWKTRYKKLLELK